MTETPLLSQRREWWGRWWLPGDEDHKFSGVLEFDPATGIVLRMVGGFEYHVFDEPVPGMRTYSGQMREWPVVFGQAENRAITLLDCRAVSGKSYNFAEPETLRLRARTVLDGCWLPDVDRAMFVGADASIENLTWWDPTSTVTGKVHFPKDGEPGPTTGELHVAPTDELAAATEHMKVTLRRTYTLPRLETNRSETVARIRDWTVLSAEFDAPVALESALEPVEAVRDLVSLATSDSCGIVWQRVWLEPQPDAYSEDHPQAGRPHKIDCYRRQQVVASPGGKTPDAEELLIRLQEVAFADLLPRWFEVRKKFQAASNIVLGMRYAPSNSLESRVTNAVGSAESFHRALNPPPPIPPEEFKKIRTALLQAVGEERKDWLHGLLSRNEPSLRTRLLDLVARLDTDVSTKLFPDPKPWVAAATNARNALAHTGQSSKHSLEELYAVSEVTSAVVILNLLQKLSVPPAGLVERMGRNRMLSRAARLAADYFSDANGTTR